MHEAALVGGIALVAAGAYQFTPAKTACLTGCRSPIGFLMQWKPGLGGAIRMGSRNGVYCVGCCWGLMLALFVLGLANLAWMGIVAAIIFIEKVTPFGFRAAKAFGVGLVALGLVMIAAPTLLGTGVFGA
jgi:predicted metal-binding membrane protein